MTNLRAVYMDVRVVKNVLQKNDVLYVLSQS